MSVQQRSLEQAAKGYVDELDQWLTMIRYFCDAKLSEDADWQYLSRMLKVLHIGQCYNVKPEKIFELIDFNRRKDAEYAERNANRREAD